MENAVIIIFILLVIFMFLQKPMFYNSEQTDLNEDQPVTWSYDWGGGAGHSRFLIDGQIS